MKLYSPPDNHQLAKLLFASKLTRTPLTHEPVPYGYKNKHFQQQNVLFTTPALQPEPNTYIFGTHSILRQIMPPQGTKFQQASINQWFELIEKQLQPAVGVLILNVNQLTEIKSQQMDRAKEIVIKVMKIVEERLKMNTFLVGQQLTIVDISLYFSWKEVSSMLEKESKTLSGVQRWSKYIQAINVE